MYHERIGYINRVNYGYPIPHLWAAKDCDCEECVVGQLSRLSIRITAIQRSARWPHQQSPRLRRTKDAGHGLTYASCAYTDIARYTQSTNPDSFGRPGSPKERLLRYAKPSQIRLGEGIDMVA